jgi:hypothetical protein
MATAAETLLEPYGPPEAGGHQADVIAFPSPCESEGSFVSAEQAQQAALEALPPYDVQVMRRTPHKEPETTAEGTFHQETVRYSDGAVRLVTIGLPHEARSPYPISSGDPWFTGPNGFNRHKITQFVADGYPVVWNHHQGRHSLKPNSAAHAQTVLRFLTSKSVSKSAAQDHALLNDLAPHADFDASRVIREGYSRSAMSGEAFIAQTALPDNSREVVWSDLEAACFVRKVGFLTFGAMVAKQLPRELQTLAQIGIEAADQSENTPAPQLSDYAGTLDVHPLNLAHEIAWLRLLISGDCGAHAEAVPLGAKGVRTVYRHDIASQQADQQRIHAVRAGIAVLNEDGGHLAGATLRMRRIKQGRFLALLDYMSEHDMDLSAIMPRDILPPALAQVA